MSVGARRCWGCLNVRVVVTRVGAASESVTALFAAVSVGGWGRRSEQRLRRHFVCVSLCGMCFVLTRGPATCVASPAARGSPGSEAPTTIAVSQASPALHTHSLRSGGDGSAKSAQQDSSPSLEARIRSAIKAPFNMCGAKTWWLRPRLVRSAQRFANVFS